MAKWQMRQLQGIWGNGSISQCKITNSAGESGVGGDGDDLQVPI